MMPPHERRVIFPWTASGFAGVASASYGRPAIAECFFCLVSSLRSVLQHTQCDYA